jgi:hypothetical protein
MGSPGFFRFDKVVVGVVVMSHPRLKSKSKFLR